MTSQHVAHMDPFVATLRTLHGQGVAKATITKILALLRKHGDKLLLEMALSKDFDTIPFLASMELESDKLMPHRVHGIMQCVKTHVSNFRTSLLSHPNIYAAAAKVVEASGVAPADAVFAARVSALVLKTTKKVAAAQTYYNQKFFAADAVLADQMLLFSAARLIDPCQIGALQGLVTAGPGLLCDAVPFLNAAGRAQLVVELELYVQLAAASAPRTSPLAFAKAHALQIPGWASFTRELVHVISSSAGAERVFGLTANLFSDLQKNQLNDAALATVILRYNSPSRRAPRQPRNDEVKEAPAGSHIAALTFPFMPPAFAIPVVPGAGAGSGSDSDSDGSDSDSGSESDGNPPAVPVPAVAAALAPMPASPAIPVPAVPAPMLIMAAPAAPVPAVAAALPPMPAAPAPPMPAVSVPAVAMAAPLIFPAALPVAPAAAAAAAPKRAPAKAACAPPPPRPLAPDNQEAAFVDEAAKLVGRKRNRTPSEASLYASITAAVRLPGHGGKRKKR